MEVTVNDTPVDARIARDITLDALLDALREHGAIAADEVVVGIRVDDHQWSADDLDAGGELPLSGARGVAIATDDLRGYCFRVLTDASGMLNVLWTAIPRVADNLRRNEARQANADLFTLLDAVQQMLTCLYQVQNMCELTVGPAAGGETALAEVQAALQEMQSRQEGKDWQALGDTLERRLLPALENVGELLEGMKGEL